MGASANRIILKSDYSTKEEYNADATINPGGAIELAADGNVDPVQSSKAEYLKKSLLVAVEDSLQGKTVSDAYSANDKVNTIIPMPGDELNLLIKSGEDINVGDDIVAEGGGSDLFVEAGGSENRYHAIALEDSGGALSSNTLLKCRIH